MTLRERYALRRHFGLTMGWVRGPLGLLVVRVRKLLAPKPRMGVPRGLNGEWRG